MRYLYLDNFRGFKDATVPILDVNFLVGENSTGKTSLLTMLGLLSSRSLIFGSQTLTGLELPAENVRFGDFAEMVSVHSTDKTYFRLGIMHGSEQSQGGKATCDGVFLTFREIDGVPCIYQITYTASQREMTIKIESDHVRYRDIPRPAVANAAEMDGRLRAWAEQHANSNDEGWKVIRPPKGVNPRQLPPFVILAIVSGQNSDKNASFDRLFPNTGPGLIWLAPIRTKALRTYDDPHTPFSPEGAHTPYVIRRMLNSQAEAAKFRQFMDKIGDASGLFQKIEIKHFNNEDKTSPFEVDAYIDGQAMSLGWLGYGVSQSLPILVELISRDKESWFAIQQPEVHLHPRAQASLGDAFFEMAMIDRKTFLIETHSDFTIDRFRMNYRAKISARKRNRLPGSQVLFFERRDKQNTVTAIPIDQQGEMSGNQPDGYRRFFLKEELRLIGTR